MTNNRLIDIIITMPDVRLIDIPKDEKRAAIAELIPLALDEVVISYDWDFATDVADEDTVANQSEYTLSGNNNNCRDIINIRYGTDTDGFVLLDKKRPVDMDDFISNRTLTGIGWWTPSGRDPSGFPKVKIFNAPTSATNVLRYRYRRNDITLAKFPEEFGFVLVSATLKRLIPAFEAVFQRDLRTMMDQYTIAGGEDSPAPLDPTLVARNNERATMYGYS